MIAAYKQNDIFLAEEIGTFISSDTKHQFRNDYFIPNEMDRIKRKAFIKYARFRI